MRWYESEAFAWIAVLVGLPALGAVLFFAWSVIRLLHGGC